MIIISITSTTTMTTASTTTMTTPSATPTPATPPTLATSHSLQPTPKPFNTLKHVVEKMPRTMRDNKGKGGQQQGLETH